MCESFGEQLHGAFSCQFAENPNFPVHEIQSDRRIADLFAATQHPIPATSTTTRSARPDLGQMDSGARWTVGHDRPTWATLGNIGDELVSAELFKTAMHAAGRHQSVAQRELG